MNYDIKEVISNCYTKKYIDDRIYAWGKQAELKVWQECRGTIQELATMLNDNPERSVEELINEAVNAPGLNGLLKVKTLELVKEYLIKKRYLKDVKK